jgi:predicted transcriptional regulator
MPVPEDNEQITLLREIAKWLRFAGMKEVKAVLTSALDSDQKKLVYHLSDGSNGSVKIAQQSGVSDFTVRSYWKQWSKVGIVEAIKVGGGDRYKKAFDLEDFGIDVPQARAAGQPNPTEQMGPAEGGKND